MSQTYDVVYNIQVIDRYAIDVISRFTRATKGIENVRKNFAKLNQSANNLSQKLKSLGSTSYKINIDTRDANAKLDALLRKINAIKRNLNLGSTNVNIGSNKKSISQQGQRTSGVKSSYSTYKGEVWYSGNKPPKIPPIKGYDWVYSEKTLDQYKGQLGKLDQLLRRRERLERKYNGTGKQEYLQKLHATNSSISRITHGYRAIPTSVSPDIQLPKPGVGGKAGGAITPAALKPINPKMMGTPSLSITGGFAVDMLKGMGIAYEISSMGSLLSDIVQKSTEYDNIIKTVENILASHDHDPQFSNKFGKMTSVVRRVGMETKYTVTEVVEAAKF